MTKSKNMAKCALCNDKIVSKHRHDWVSCKCGEIFIDGGNDYWRAGAKDFRNLLRYKNRKWVPSLVEEPKTNELTKITPYTPIFSWIKWVDIIGRIIKSKRRK